MQTALKKVYKTILSERKRNAIRNFLQQSTYPLYLGNSYYCNCCGKSFRKFLPMGNTKRANAKCPYCLSLERTRVLDLYLANELDLYNKQGQRLLHFAPEACLSKKIESIAGVDYVDGDINPANARNIIDITDIRYPENYFDLIICAHVLGHVPDEHKAIKEMYRVLKADGIALIMTLIDSKSAQTFEDQSIVSYSDRLKHYSESDLCRLHGLDFSDRLANQRFEVEVIDYRLSFTEEKQKHSSLGNGEREVIFKCTK